ncbi:glycosyltransferase family 4 protein [Acidicapsa acidisoli]|uniref:glycosyltransferase family 4 protein n=1 Tax=Acidicapsa acidisoli TaxID=1615681 RepID=UPI0021E03471|nr:glycosyltransferase family 1 protein [Acidicapsa acidisoli]
MNVLIALASSSGQLSGVQRHAINLARCLLSRDEITAVHLVAAPWQRDFIQDSTPSMDMRLHVHGAPIGNNAFSRNLWYLSQLPSLARQLGVDIVHLAYPVPVRRGAYHCPTVVTLHDLYPHDIPDNFGFPKVLFNRLALRRCLTAVNAIACVSQCTLFRLETIYPKLASAKSLVVNNSVELPTLPLSNTSRPRWGDEPFLLCVAQHRRNKNVALALRVFERLLRTNRLGPQTRLVIVGIPGPETSTIQQFVASAGLRQNVVFLNGISDALLQWCYRKCLLLLAPSTIEGFGLPIAEALQAGCPIVCSDIPAFRELGEDHCHYVPLGFQEVEAFSDAVCAAAGRQSREPLAMPHLSAEVIAAQYLQLYSALLSAPGAELGVQDAQYLSSSERHFRT